MTSSASLVLALAIASGGSTAAWPNVSTPLATRIAERIALEWGAPASSIGLTWGRLAAGATVPEDAPIQLGGHGAGGWFVVRFGEGTNAIAARVRASVEQVLPVASRALPRGTVLTAGDIRRELRRDWGPPVGAEGTLAEAGWILRRPVAAGERLVGPAVSPPAWVEAGGPVRLVWSRGEIRVALEGTALNAAGEGELVRARVAGRLAPVRGVMTSPGTARLAVEAGR